MLSDSLETSAQWPQGAGGSVAAPAAYYAEVALEKAGSGVFTYALPELSEIKIGSVVLAPLGARRLPGVVIRVHTDAPAFPTRSLDAAECWGPVLSEQQVTLATWLARHYRAPLWDALALMLPPGLARRLSDTAARESGKLQTWLRRLLDGGSGLVLAPEARERAPVATATPLTPHQVHALRPLARSLIQREHRVFLLHGVTGSGKTEVYLGAAEQVIAAGGQVLVLVSEIALTPEATERFSARFPGQVAVLHSGLAARQREQVWARVRGGGAALVVGSRSAVFAPLERLRLIVVDEEHEWTYKQDASPRYHARDVAVARARLAGACVVLSSATPDVASYHAATRGRYHLLTLPERYRAGERAAITRADSSRMPTVEVVDLRRELREGNTSIFSRAMATALEQTYARGEQAILFLNRRGAATCVTCRDCGHTLQCRRCETPLAFHGRRVAPPGGERDGQAEEDSSVPGAGGQQLVCHRCNRRRTLTSLCPRCGSPRIRFLGIGTQRVEQEVRTLLPEARVQRWDRDATASRGAHEALWRAFSRGEADVLVGTQMVAKALDVPRVTLVGAVLADSALYLPDFRAAERTFQLLTQVAGRAGRGVLPGRAIIQTYNVDHYAIRAAARHDYHAFQVQEIAFRRQFGYPPFRRLVRLVYSASNETRCWREAMRARRLISESLRRHDLVDAELVGPAPCFLRRLRGRYRWQLLLFGDSGHRALDEVPLGHGWTVDVDPVSVL